MLTKQPKHSMQSKLTIVTELAPKAGLMNQWILSQTPKMSQLVAPKGDLSHRGGSASNGKIIRVTINDQAYEIMLPAEPVKCGWVLAQVKNAFSSFS